MLNRIYRLMDIKRIEMVQREVKLAADSVLVRPEIMAICAADQRYYCGNRKREVLLAKLPMALIHEAVGTVLYDMNGRYPVGAKVALFPLEAPQGCLEIKANYRTGSRFHSSGIDGFMQDLIAISADRVVQVPQCGYEIYVFSELMSVAVNAVENMKRYSITEDTSFGVWGDGSMGFVMALTLRAMFPCARLYVFGRTPRKLHMFSFADKTFYIDNVPDNIAVKHCFECVGGKSSEDALEQAVSLVEPQGSINLLGVSEEPISLNTRAAMDKGVLLSFNSRSDINDFNKAVGLISNNNVCKRYLPLLVSETVEVKTEDGIRHAFEQDILNDFKTLIKWSI